MIDARIADIDRRLAADFSGYAALVSPASLSVEDVQAHLRPDEALVMFLDTPEVRNGSEETFIWVVTKTDLRWARSDLGRAALAAEVKALRCGLDFLGAWKDDACQKVLGVKYAEQDNDAGKPLPFHAGRAHALYQALFGPIEDLIANKKHLLMALSGPLTALPVHALVTEKPGDAIPASYDAYAKLKWLGQSKAFTILPSVSSLRTLRRDAKPSAAPNPYAGFGNPLLSGAHGTDQRAWQKQSCPKASFRDRLSASLGVIAQPVSQLFRGNYANVEKIRFQPPLPETTDEICEVARLMDADPAHAVYLGAKATEAQVKALSASGALAKVRVLHFATHGLIASETKWFIAARQAEPALLLTPPNVASETDDGLLTASEAAALKLDADLVILSACNTAAGAGDAGGEAFSGLARGFIYAGARSLLVSHWYVDSRTTVKLVSRAFAEMKANPQIGRAEAMRLAMAALIAGGGRGVHPASWAPFVVVGEGGVGP